MEQETQPEIIHGKILKYFAMNCLIYIDPEALWRRLTDLEKATQVTARSKTPMPRTCRVLRLTESHTRTWGWSTWRGERDAEICFRTKRRK